MHWHVRIAGDPPQTYAMAEVDLARLDSVMPILAWWLLPPYRARQASVQVPFFDRLAAATGQIEHLCECSSVHALAAPAAHLAGVRRPERRPIGP